MILPSELLALIEQGETLTVEFKKSTADITKDTYETVCSFSNRDGGHIFLGVKINSKWCKFSYKTFSNKKRFCNYH